MIQEISSYFTERGYRSISVNVENVRIFYTERESCTIVIVMLTMYSGNEFTKEQYENMIRQIRERFNREQYKETAILGMIATGRPELVKAYCNNVENTWIIDLDKKRIIRYENQGAHFGQLYRELELRILPPPADADQAAAGVRSRNTVRRRTLPFGICNAAMVSVNVIIFLIMNLFGMTDIFFEKGAIYWPSIQFNNEYYRLITGMFIHSGISHLANNMLILLFIGDNLEKTVGKIRYLIIYFGTGIIAGYVSMKYNMNQGELISSVGASGAIFGVVGAVAYLVIVNKGRLQNISKRQIILFILLSLYGGLTSSQVDNAAHIGGLIAGVLVTAVIYHLHKKGHGK